MKIKIDAQSQREISTIAPTFVLTNAMSCPCIERGYGVRPKTNTFQPIRNYPAVSFRTPTGNGSMFSAYVAHI